MWQVLITRILSLAVWMSIVVIVPFMKDDNQLTLMMNYCYMALKVFQCAMATSEVVFKRETDILQSISRLDNLMKVSIF